MLMTGIDRKALVMEVKQLCFFCPGESKRRIARGSNMKLFSFSSCMCSAPSPLMFNGYFRVLTYFWSF